MTISVSGSAVRGCRDHLRQKFSSIEERKKRFCGGESTTTMGRCIVSETTVFKSIYNFKTGNRLLFRPGVRSSQSCQKELWIGGTAPAEAEVHAGGECF